jgi:hypothetical protein
MVIENVAVQVDRSFEITSQKAKRTRDPLTKLGRREDVVEGDMRRIDGQDPLNRPQRGWLSSGYSTGNYVYDNIGGAGSFIYVIDGGFLEGHTVGALFWPFIYLFISLIILTDSGFWWISRRTLRSTARVTSNCGLPRPWNVRCIYCDWYQRHNDPGNSSDGQDRQDG